MGEASTIRVLDHWLLRGVAPEDVAFLIESGQEVWFEPGEVVFNEGDPAVGLFLITSGTVRLTAAGDANETLIALSHANDVLGELGVLDDLPRSARATAVGVCTAFFIPAERFLDALERSTSLCLRLMAFETKRLRYANGRLGEVPATVAIPAEEASSVA